MDENLSVITEVGIVQTVGALVGAEAVPGVDEGDGFAVHGQGIQLPPLDPAHGHAVVVAGGVADGVVGDGVTIVGGEQILPVRVAVGIGVGGVAIGDGEKIAHAVIGIGVGLSTAGGLGQLRCMTSAYASLPNF